MRALGAEAENPLLYSGAWHSPAPTPASTGVSSLPKQATGSSIAQDVVALSLHGTRLVVLSACDTGLGSVRNGQGVYGLRLAFSWPVRSSLVLSLWKVPDTLTKELMVDFYQRLLRGEGRAEALANAQDGLRDRPEDVVAWGAFICEGDPRPLRANVVRRSEIHRLAAGGASPAP